MVAKHNTISLHISTIAAITVHYLTKKLHFILFSHRKLAIRLCIYFWLYDIIYLLTAIGLILGGNSKVHIYTQKIHKKYTEQHNETEYTERNVHNNKNT